VESSGSKSLVNPGQSTYIFYVRFNHFLPTFRGAVKGHGFVPFVGSIDKGLVNG